MSAAATRCAFCAIAAGESPADIVLDAPRAVAFLDHRPLLRGHLLVIPRDHVETLDDLPAIELGGLFATVQRLSVAVQRGLAADGSLTVVNTRVSQSVPHLHVHVVPRWQGDGLFSPKMLWRRHPYRDAGARAEVAARLRDALASTADRT